MSFFTGIFIIIHSYFSFTNLMKNETQFRLELNIFECAIFLLVIFAFFIIFILRYPHRVRTIIILMTCAGIFSEFLNMSSLQVMYSNVNVS